jgi:hypothetical protein
MIGHTPEDILSDLAALAPADLAQVRDYVAFLRWRSEAASQGIAETTMRPWRFSLLEAFGGAGVRANRDPAGMEVKIAEAIVGGDRRPALWQHPPVDGESLIEFHVPVPTGLNNLRLRTAMGIRAGAQAGDRLVAFRVRVDGRQVWSRAAWPAAWKPVEIALPFHAGDVLRLALVTDALGDHQWAWAVWGEPELAGEIREEPAKPDQLGN